MVSQKPNVIEMSGIVKDFPGVRALNNVDFSVREGEIHGLVGENGAGKSTLIKILAGVYQRDAGEIKIRGKAYDALSPALVEKLGVQFIHQERYLVPHFTVAQSLFLGHEMRHSGLPFLNIRGMRERAEAFKEETLGISLPGNTLIRDLSVAEAQLVQIAKALSAQPTILVFDEPTAPLARREVERLFEVMHRLKQQNITTIYISHYLQEISEICDRVTVLRNGENVGTLEVSKTTPDEIVHLMVGRELTEMFPRRNVSIGEPILTVQDLERQGEFRGINFEVRRGEVVGLTGLIGSGHQELIDTLYGLKAPESGSISLLGLPLKKLSPSQAVSRGVVLVPRDRRQLGLVLSSDISDNVNLASLERVSRFGFVQRRRARERTKSMIKNLDIRAPGPQTIVRYLSGGNQQKVVLARWLSSEAEVYLLDEPTVGIDVGAKVEIYQLINQLASQGAGVIFVSSDIPELLGMTDRLLIMYRGEIVKEFETASVTPDKVLSWSTGGQIET